MRPIGVFDSGVGGLSVLQALQTELPHERFVYLADNGHAPYGEKSDVFVLERSLRITQHLIDHHHIKALVVACNTATAAAIHAIRAQHPQLPVVGVEPAIKPALNFTQTRRIGVMATRGTVNSHKFKLLVAQHQDQAQYVVCACNGLALAIEQSTHVELAKDADATIDSLLDRYLNELGDFGSKSGQIDTLVLGCTHYVFVADRLRERLGSEVQILSTGEAVARQTARLLQQHHELQAPQAQASNPARVTLYTTGDVGSLQSAAARWLNLPASSCHRADASVA